ncbi:Hypothetical predicted protein [Mytilus galloprovincialis]|uniref:RNB domain-containing protein n=1 Tax=Mytilus galloprovincialis TaxID=29158 RepID=A0A8B6BYI6_MYTGA|nr:Hypothetical predicted protein [Mytilus galloprovincialis]
MAKRLFGLEEETTENEWLEGTNIQAVEQQHRYSQNFRQYQHTKTRKKHIRPKSQLQRSSLSIYESDADSSGSELSQRSCPELRGGNHKTYHTKKKRRKKKLLEEEYDGKIDSDWDDRVEDTRKCLDWKRQSDESFTDSQNDSDSHIVSSDNYSTSENEADSEDDDESFFEKSREFYKENKESTQFVEIGVLQNGLELSERCVEAFMSENVKKGKKFVNFYKDLKNRDQSTNIHQREGNSNRRCILQIVSSHTAKCTVIEPIDNIEIIEISGRSKCGKTYSDDEVLVKVLKKEGQNEFIPRWDKRIQTELKTYGEVVGLFDHKRYKDVDHPVLVCELDNYDNDKVKPICKTVPKIQLVSERDLDLFEVEIFTYDKKMKSLAHKDIMKINPSKRKVFMFFVVIIGWKSLYPLGAIIEVHKSSANFKSGLKILELQYSVPTLYSKDTIDAIERLPVDILDVKIENRLDLTQLRTFTIDPSNSKDLDDALSIETLKKGYKVGIHIADVSAYIDKDDSIDLEAQIRATTFYPGGGKRAYQMLPEPLTEKCSLLPGERRLTLTVFLLFDKEFHLLPFRSFEKTTIRSHQQFNYTRVQDIIDKQVDSEWTMEINLLHGIAKKLRQQRFGCAVYAFPVEVDLYDETDSQMKTQEAHYLVEEFMVLANSSVADALMMRFPEHVPLRCQDPPNKTKIQEWLKLYPQISNLIFHLQEKQPLPNHKLAISNMENENGCSVRYTVVTRFQKWVWEKLIKCIEDGNFTEAFKIFGQDENHPFQSIALDEWYSFQETAEYRCSGKPSGLESKHFSLPTFSGYVHFTSPIRRYVDIIVHRLLHALKDCKESPYSSEEVADLCFSITKKGHLAKTFSKKCRALYLANKIVRQPVMLHGFVKEIKDRDLELLFPGLRSLPSVSKKLQYNLLDVCALPKQVKNQDDLHSEVKRQMIELKWERRIYSKTEKPPRPKSKLRGYLRTPDDKGGPYQRIDPHQRTEFQQLAKWIGLINVMCKDKKPTEMRNILRNMSIANIFRFIPTTFYTELDVNSERDREDTQENEESELSNDQRQIKSLINDQFCKYSMSFSHGQVLAVQMGTDFEKGIILPKPQMFNMTGNVKYCLQHASDPVRYFEKYSTTKSKDRYDSETDYMQIWLQIVRMETAMSATREPPIVINDLPISFESRGGHFTLFTSFCDERNIDLHSMSVDKSHTQEDLIQDENKTEYVSCSDYLCIKCPISRKTNTFFEPRQNACPFDFSYWLSHAKIDKTKTVKKNTPEERINVHFSLVPSAPSVPESLIDTAKKFRCSIDLIQKSELDKRIEVYIGRLKEASTLAKCIAMNKAIPRLDKAHLESIAEYDVPAGVIASNNDMQCKAIEKALTSTFSLIHGPPELFQKYFKDHSVDFARYYGGSMENHDYPIPGRVYSARACSRDSIPDSGLKPVSIHHLIRNPEKPHAYKLCQYEETFRKKPNQINAEKVKEYTKLLTLATIEEISQHDIIFCTTAMATNKRLIEGTKNRIFQCIIDEAGMCTEPECIATIIATKAEQVVLIGDHKQLQPVILCQSTAKLGLDKSLFQRYSDRSVQLKDQYRMHPSICKFPSKCFYQDKLRTIQCLSWEENPPLHIWFQPEKRHLFCHVEGEEVTLPVSTEEGNEMSRSNKKEVEQIMKIFTHLVKKEKIFGDHKKKKVCTVNIMSQYNAQCSAIREALGALILRDVDLTNTSVNTVVGSQGGQWDYVIFSLVRSIPQYRIEPHPTLGWCTQNLGFITDEHQINVALTRAKKGLFIIGNRHLLKCDRVWRQLINMYASQGSVVEADDFPRPIPKPKKCRQYDKDGFELVYSRQ